MANNCERCGAAHHLLHCNSSNGPWSQVPGNLKQSYERAFRAAMGQDSHFSRQQAIAHLRGAYGNHHDPSVNTRSAPAQSNNTAGPNKHHGTLALRPAAPIRQLPIPTLPNPLQSQLIDVRVNYNATKINPLRTLKSSNPTRTDIHQVRPAYPIPSTSKNQSTVYANHFEIALSADFQLDEYELTGFPNGTSKAKKKRLTDTFVTASSPLAQNRELFAVDNACNIITWDAQTIGLVSNNGVVATHTVNKNPRSLPQFADHITLQLRFVRTHTRNDIASYIRSTATIADATRNLEPIKKAIAAVLLDGLRRQAGTHLATFPAGASNKFYMVNAVQALGRNAISSLVTRRGYTVTIAPGMGRISLNLDTATSAFYRPGTVKEFIDRFRADVRPDDGQLQMALHRVQVYINFDRIPKDYQKGTPLAELEINQRHKRDKTIWSVGLPADQQTFDLNGTETTVVKFFEMQYGLGSVKFPNYNAINVGSKDAPVWYPPEKLDIPDHQIYRSKVPGRLHDDMLRDSCRSPQQNFALILGEGLPTLGFRPAQNGAGPPLTLANGMIVISAALTELPSSHEVLPSIAYPGQRVRQPNRSARWTQIPDGGTSFEFADMPEKHLKYHVLICGEMNPEFHKKAAMQFSSEMVHAGFDTATLSDAKFHSMQNGWSDDIAHAAFKYAKDQNCDILITINAIKEQKHYSWLKTMADCKYGLPNNHFIEATLKKCDKGTNRPLKEYFANISVKVNAKQGGVNHQVIGLDKYTEGAMVFGVDVTHPDAGAHPGTPSIAGVVGSLDDQAGKYISSLTKQRGRQEMVADILQIFTNELTYYVEHGANGMRPLPNKVFYLRDGVGDSQFQTLLDTEVSRLETAANNVRRKHPSLVHPAKIAIAVLVANKDHDETFMPKGNATSTNNGNLQPGSIVDSGITSPYRHDFFIIPHNAQKGTGKLVRYTVLRDDSNYSSAEIHDFVMKLSYNYARSTIGTSLVTPIQYAHWLCERGRCYLRKWMVPDAMTRALHADTVSRDIDTSWSRNRNEFGPWQRELNGTLHYL